MNQRSKQYMEELGIKKLEPIKKKINLIKKTRYKEITFAIIGEPMQTQRPRSGKFGNMYVPNAKKNRKFIQKQIREQVDIENFDIISGQVKVEMSFYVSIPKSFSKTDKLLAEMKYIRPTIIPDIDNFMKTYMDALTGLIWLDDGQVIEGKVKKFYSFEPRVECKIIYTNDIHCSVLKTYAKNKKENHDASL